MERSKHDLVDKMPFLFVRVVRARGLPARALTAVKGTAENTSTPASSCHEARTDTLRIGRFRLRRQMAPAVYGGE
jgi:hypothetical protein